METKFHFDKGLKELSADAFLGEEKSLCDHSYMLDHVLHSTNDKLMWSRQSSQGNNGVSRSWNTFAPVTRSQSLQMLQRVDSSVNLAPCTLPMPQSRSHIDLGDSLENIPIYSWILPYIIACSPAEFIQQLLELPSLFSCQSLSTLPSKTRSEFRSPGNIQLKLPHPISSLPRPTPLKLSINHTVHGTNCLPFSNTHSKESSPFQKNSAGEVMCSRTSSPVLLNPINFPASWRSVGPVLICKDPAWKQWDSRRMYLLDNYLLECCGESGTSIIGYAPLSGAIIQRATLTARRVSSVPYHADDAVNDEAYALKVSVHTTTSKDSNLQSFWITLPSTADLDTLEAVLQTSVHLTAEDVYEHAEGSDIDTILGKGRFNIVRLAKRRKHRKLINPHYCQSYRTRQTSTPVRGPTLDTAKHSRSHVEDELDRSHHPRYLSSKEVELFSLPKVTEGIALMNQQESSCSTDSTVHSPCTSTNSCVSEESQVFKSVSSAGNSQHDPDYSVHSQPSRSYAPSFSDTIPSALSALEYDTVKITSPRDSALSDHRSRTVSWENTICSRVAAELNAGKCDESDGDEDGGFSALKVVSKQVFWNRVDSQKERGDSLVREVLAQVLLSSHFLAPNSLSRLQSNYIASQTPRQLFSNPPDSPTLATPLSSIMSVESGELPIVQVLSVFETLDEFSLELELMEGRDLYEILAESTAELSEKYVQQIISQLIDAISLCNRLGIAHRDVKLSNITVPRRRQRYTAAYNSLKRRNHRLHHMGNASSRLASQCDPSPEDDDDDDDDDDDYFAIKLADFGMAGFVCADRKLKGRCGTPGYVAPDILWAKPNESYSLNVDMFSVGVVAYALLSGVEPFYDREVNVLKHNNQFVRYDFDDPVWQTVSESAKDFIRKALQLQAETRINPEESKRHPWLCGFFYNQNKPNVQSALHSPHCNGSGSESLDALDIKNNNSVYYFRQPGAEVHTDRVSQQIISISQSTTGESSLSNTTMEAESVGSDIRSSGCSSVHSRHHGSLAMRNNNNSSCTIT